MVSEVLPDVVDTPVLSWVLPVPASAWAGPATVKTPNVPATSATMVTRTRFLLTSTSPKKLYFQLQSPLMK
jgi:hypothetical protein